MPADNQIKLEKVGYSILHSGPLHDWRKWLFEDPKVPKTKGKRFLKGLLKLTGMEVSLNVLAPGEGIPFYHKHRENEELYIFIKGKGQFQVDKNIFDVTEGSVVKVAPECIRAYRNHSDQDLYFIVVQAKHGAFFSETISDGIGVREEVKWKKGDM